MTDKTVYVEDQTSAQLRSHMKMLLRMPGWHNPLPDRLWKEIQEQDAELKYLHAEIELLKRQLVTASSQATLNYNKGHEDGRKLVVAKTLTDEEILNVAFCCEVNTVAIENDLDGTVIAFARAILRKAQEK